MENPSNVVVKEEINTEEIINGRALKEHIKAVDENIKVETVDNCNEMLSVKQEIPEILIPTRREDMIENAELKDDPLSFEIYKCNFCEKSFSRGRTLKEHIKVVHEGIKKHECDQCQKCFSDGSSLKNHVKVHKGIKDHKCNNCGKSFARKGTLKAHIKMVHEEIKDHNCNFCEKSFATAGNLKTHVKTVHEGFKGHKCNFCGKGFSQARSLKGHLKSVHEGIKDHKCDVCKKSFSQAGHLKIHVITVHEGVKDHKCDHCGKNFSKGKNLKKHIKAVHEGIKDHYCDHCGKICTTAVNLKQHIKAIHYGSRRNHKFVHNEKSFSQAANHVKSVHEEIKGHMCDHSDKSFTKGDNLKISKKEIKIEAADFIECSVDPSDVHDDEFPNYNMSSASYSMNPDSLNQTFVPVEANKEKTNAENELFLDSLENKKSKKVKQPNHEVKQNGILIKMFHSGNIHKCDICNKIFIHTEGLEQHIREFHENSEIV